LSYYVRLMHPADIAQVTKIDRQSFTDQWPAANYERELERWLAHCIVACPEDDEPTPSSEEYVIGAAGFWMLNDEAHITNLAVRKPCRRRGTGELLLITMIDMATEMDARILTLEVRASNTTAQSLYGKYGFARVGLRRGYYQDDKEDAVLMTVAEPSSAQFQALLKQLKRAHNRRWRVPLRRVAP